MLRLYLVSSVLCKYPWGRGPETRSARKTNQLSADKAAGAITLPGSWLIGA